MSNLFDTNKFFEKQNKINSDFSGIQDLASKFSQKLNPYESASAVLAKSTYGNTATIMASKMMAVANSSFNQYPISANMILSKIMRDHEKLSLPQTALDAINSINKQHAQVIDRLKIITDSAIYQTSAVAQIRNLQNTLSSISSHVKATALQHENWQILAEFEQITEKTIEFTETLNKGVNEEQEKKFQGLILLVLIFINNYKELGLSVFATIINTISTVATIHMYYDFLKPKPELATKEDLNELIKKQDLTNQYIQKLTEQLKKGERI